MKLSKYIFFISFYILFLTPALYSQFESDSKIHTQSFKIKKQDFQIQITLSSKVDENSRIRVYIKPVFYDDLMLPVDDKTIKKLGLSCKLNTLQIKISPQDYCDFRYPGDSLLTLAVDKEFPLNFELSEDMDFDKDLIVKLPFVIEADKKVQKKITAELIFKIDKTPPTEKMPESDKTTQEQENAKAATDMKTGKVTDASGAGGKPAGEKSGAGATADPDSIPTDALEKVLGDIKSLNSEIYTTFDKREESPITSEKINQFKNRLELIKNKYNIQYAKLSEVPKATGLISNYEYFYTKTTDLLNELERNLAGTEKSELTKKDKEIANSQKKNKTLQIILIVLGAILFGIVLFVLMKFVMKKVKKSFEKKMKRKAALELNKQKFKVTQQQNKLKV